MENINLERPEDEAPVPSPNDPDTVEYLKGIPLSEQSVEQIYGFFRDCDQIACIFHSQDIYDICPHFLAAFELVSCLGQGLKFDRPAFKSEQIANRSDEALQQIERLAEARIQELHRRSGLRFAVCWAIGGHMEPRCSHSDDMSREEAVRDLVDRVVGDVDCYMGSGV